MAMLNKLFMEHITDFIAAGEVAQYLPGGDIEISHVKITADYNTVNVFWVDSNIHDITQRSKTDEMLQQCAKYLRYELSQLRLMGTVPPIQFVRNKFINIALQVEERLKVADFGEDYIPSSYPWEEKKVVMYNDLKAENINDTKTDSTENIDDLCYMTLPIMRNDVLGLDHHRIMSKIKILTEKAQKSSMKSTLKRMPHLDTQCNTNSISHVDVMTEKQRRELFTKFLSKRRRELRLKNRNKNNETLYNLDMEECNTDNDTYDEYNDPDVYDDYEDYKDNA
ncbi:hypothetical protein KM043_009462 [Ampulex compressa]|nr:hypothetical protein KM043_009462 [Ampulex compressa]